MSDRHDPLRPGVRPPSPVTAAFAGVATGRFAPREPVLVESWEGFLQLLLAPAPGAGGEAVEQSGVPAQISALPPIRGGAPAAEAWWWLPSAVRGFFDNGGRRLRIGVADPAGIPALLDRLAALPGTSLLAAPGLHSPAIHDALLTACARRPGCFALLDGPEGAEPHDLLPVAKRRSSPMAALYAPWLRVDAFGREALAPPSGHVAGVLSRIEERRGVWKAPAGTEAAVGGVTGLAQRWKDPDQAIVHPAGVNVIREVPGSGPVLWGAQTLGGKEGPPLSTARGLAWIAGAVDRGVDALLAAAEPDDVGLLDRIELWTGEFLEGLRGAGTLVGTKPQEGWFARCERPEGSTGRIECRFGVALLRPGGFIVLSVVKEG